MILAITTAPRTKETLTTTLKSLRRAHFDEPAHIFAEPGSIIAPYDNLNYHWNETTLGGFKNYDNTLKWLRDNTTDELIMVCQDDILVSRRAWYHLHDFLKSHTEQLKDTGYISLYLSRHHKDLGKNKGFNQHYIGWNPCFWGALCYVFTRHGLEALLDYHAYQNYGSNQQIDCIICECFTQMGMRMYYHSPSLIDHVGRHSTLGHPPMNDHRGFQFQI